MKKTETITTLDPTGTTAPVSRGSWLRALSFRNISAVYIFIVLFAIFAIVTPRTFLTPGTWLVLLDAQSVTVLAAIAVLIPLVNGVFNLAIGAEVGFAVILVAVLQVKLGDLSEADEIFSKLMGDVVEPRREFIQENALSASVDA